MPIENKDHHCEYSSQKAPTELGEEKFENHKNWDELANKIEKSVDALNLGIDSGIKDSVIAFNAYGLPTSQSCEGHLDPEDGHNPYLGPWVEVYPNEPKQEGWEYDDNLRDQVINESDKYLTKAKSLLDEFYTNREVANDVKLTTDQIAYGFRVQSSGLKALNNPTDQGQREKALGHKQEMREFTKFLKEKYFTENNEAGIRKG